MKREDRKAAVAAHKEAPRGSPKPGLEMVGCVTRPAGQTRRNGTMTKPVIFTVSAAWDEEAAVWTGHCDDIPTAADAPTLDELLSKISAMAPDLLPDHHPTVDPAALFIQITALKEAEPAAA